MDEWDVRLPCVATGPKTLRSITIPEVSKTKILPCRPLTAVTSRHEPNCSPGVGMCDVSHSPVAPGTNGSRQVDVTTVQPSRCPPCLPRFFRGHLPAIIGLPILSCLVMAVAHAALYCCLHVCMQNQCYNSMRCMHELSHELC